MPETEVASESVVYLQADSDEYYCCQHLRNGELILIGLLTMEQIEARCPGAEIVYGAVPSELSHPYKHPESRLIPNRTFALHPGSGQLVEAENSFTIPKAGRYKLVMLAGCPFLDPED